MVSPVQSRDRAFYFSPGITFGWNIGNGFSVTPKISFGIINETTYTYYNITYGCNFAPQKRADSFNYKYYHFIEAEGGSIISYCGGGAGIALLKSGDETYLGPKITAFAGIGVFANMDIIVTKNGINANIGLQPNLPIPMMNLSSFLHD